jgi:hypothetical protein
MFHEYGSAPFTVGERIDITLTAAKETGRALFTRADRGKFRPTVHGEAYLTTTYMITKGNQPRPEEK